MIIIEKNKNDNIKNLIHTIRGKPVMLDSDVAMLYNYTTKRINETVRRNKERFPENFCFQLTQNEIENLRTKFDNLCLMENNWSQIATASEKINSKFRNKKYLPYAFTEQGIAMLSGLLRSEVAIKVSINIMNAFVEMRKFISLNGQVFERLTNIEYKLLEHDNKFNQVFNAIQNKNQLENIQKIFFNGQIWDSYELIINIIKSANNRIIIIDNYIDYNVLSMLSRKKDLVEVIIITSANTTINKLDINKFNTQYPTLKIVKTNKFHDRFIIVDNNLLYHIGASLKDLGKRCFAISKIEDIECIDKLKSYISLQ